MTVCFWKGKLYGLGININILSIFFCVDECYPWLQFRVCLYNSKMNNTGDECIIPVMNK